MDLQLVISNLRRELELVNHAIESIERLAANSSRRRGRPATKTTKRYRRAGQKAATEGGS
jgi:hypothetical protein